MINILEKTNEGILIKTKKINDRGGVVWVDWRGNVRKLHIESLVLFPSGRDIGVRVSGGGIGYIFPIEQLFWTKEELVASMVERINDEATPENQS